MFEVTIKLPDVSGKASGKAIGHVQGQGRKF